MLLLVALIIASVFMKNCATEQLQMDNATVIVGIKNSNLNKSNVGILKPWKKYYQEYPITDPLELGEMEVVDCLERATKKTVLIRPFRLLGKWYENGTYKTNSMQDSLHRNQTDVAVRLIYASLDRRRELDFVWDIGRVHGELVVRDGLDKHGDLFTTKIVFGLIASATVAIIMAAFAVYLFVTSGKPMMALFQGVSLISQGVDEDDFVHKKSIVSGRMILMVGALASVICMSTYTAGLASRIASIKHIAPTLDGLHDLGYTWVFTQSQNRSIVLGTPDFLIDGLKERKATFKKISEDTYVAPNLYRGLVEVMYSNKTAFLVHKSGALRRNEDSFAQSKVGTLSYVELDISRRASLPMSHVQSRRKVVVDALLKIRESGLLKVVANLWLGTKQHDRVIRHNPSFLPAGLIQTKSVFVALVFGQIFAVAIGIAECIHNRLQKKNIEHDYLATKSPGGCPTCGCCCGRKQRIYAESRSPLLMIKW